MVQRIVRCIAVALSVCAGQVVAQEPTPRARPALDSAVYAWEGGRYPEALERFERLLKAPDRDSVLAPIALVTGELYRTRQIAPNASNLRWSADGAVLAYDIGEDSAQRSVLVRLDDSGAIRPDTLPGYAAAFAPDGSEVSYIRTGGATAVRRPTAGGAERVLEMPGLVGLALVYAADSGPPYLVATADPSKPLAELYELGAAAARPLPGGERVTGLPQRAAGGRLVFASAEGGVTVRAPNGTTSVHRGLAPTVSADGSSLAFVSREGGEWTIRYGRIGAEPAVLVRSPRPLADPAISPDGALLVYQGMPREDWELYTVPTAGGEPRRLTYEIQHDIAPQFVSGGRILAVMGEGRHRRSYLYDPATGVRTRLFHNNTVRTIAPEYEWAPRPDGQVVAIVSDRDGDTVSPESGLYITDLRRTVSAEEVLGRVRESLRGERDLRLRGTAMFAPVATRVKAPGGRDLVLPYLRLCPIAVRVRVEACHSARESARHRLSPVHPPVLRL